MTKKQRELTLMLKRLESRLESEKKKNRLAHYNKERVHQKQMEFHKCLKRNRWVFGGNRSGKTECGAAEAVWLARGIHPYRTNRPACAGWVVSVSSAVQRDVAQSKILDYLNPDWIGEVVMVSGKSGNPRCGVIDFITVKNVLGGYGRIGFKSCEAGREKFQGASLDFVWFDEEPPEDIYEECRMRVVDKKGELFATMTPLKGQTFVYDKIYLNPTRDGEIWCVFMEWADNPYLDKDEIKSVSAAMDDALLQVRRYGRFSCGGGLVYGEFDPSAHVVEPFDVPLEWQDKISVDPGLNNPLSCHFYAVDGDGNVFVTAEHYAAGKDLSWHCEAIKRQAEALNWHTDSFGRVYGLIDSAANQRTLAACKSVTELFLERGFSLSPKVNKDLLAGISTVKSYLTGALEGRAGLYVFSTCHNLIRELKGYRWGEGDAPIKKDDHALDELRYYLMSRPQRPREKTQANLLSEYKTKLVRRLKKGALR